MRTVQAVKPPEYLGLLPDREASKYLTLAVLLGTEELPQNALAMSCIPLDDDTRWQAEPVRELVEEAMGRFSDRPTRADAWLAPRLHSVLRVTRREAADPGLWNFLALRLGSDYVLWRHARASGGAPQPVNSRRFCGPFHTQAFSRLWWAAELFRDGSDYGPVTIACGNQDVLNTALRMEIILHRPTAQAIIRLLSEETLRGGREVNALAQAINAAGSTLFFEVVAPDGITDPDAYRAWSEQAGMTHVPYEALPDGPDDGAVPLEAVETLLPLFTKLFEEAPVRGRETMRKAE